MNRFNFKSLYTAASYYPETQIIVKTGIKLQQEGKDDYKIVQDSLTFTHSMANRYYTRFVMQQNEDVNRAINNLAMIDCWVNLAQIARHAIEEAGDVCERIIKRDNVDSTIEKEMLEAYRFERDIMTMGIHKWQEILKPEVFKKYFPSKVPANDE